MQRPFPGTQPGDGYLVFSEICSGCKDYFKIMIFKCSLGGLCMKKWLLGSVSGFIIGIGIALSLGVAFRTP
jgi:hypothetical protein